MVNIEQR